MDDTSPPAVATQTRDCRTAYDQPVKRRLWTLHGAKDFMNYLTPHKHPILTSYPYSTDQRYEEERAERKAAKKRDRSRGKRDDDEFSDDGLEDWERSEARAPKMLEAPAPASTVSGATQSGYNGSSDADFIRDNQRRRERDGDGQYNMSGGLGRRDEGRRDDSRRDDGY